MSQGTININYTLELYCRPLRTMDGSRATNYQHVLNSAIHLDVLMVSDRNKTGKICYELHDRLYCFLVSLFSCIDLALLSVLNVCWMQKQIHLRKANQLCIGCTDFGTYMMYRKKKFPVKAMWKLCFPVCDNLISFRLSKKILEHYLQSGHHLFFAHSSQFITH
jgi:hypothetical protein